MNFSKVSILEAARVVNLWQSSRPKETTISSMFPLLSLMTDSNSKNISKSSSMSMGNPSILHSLMRNRQRSFQKYPKLATRFPSLLKLSKLTWDQPSAHISSSVSSTSGISVSSTTFSPSNPYPISPKILMNRCLILFS